MIMPGPVVPPNGLEVVTINGRIAKCASYSHLTRDGASQCRSSGNRSAMSFRSRNIGFHEIPKIVHYDLMLHSIPQSVIAHNISIFLRHELEKMKKDKSLEKTS